MKWIGEFLIFETAEDITNEHSNNNLQEDMMMLGTWLGKFPHLNEHMVQLLWCIQALYQALTDRQLAHSAEKIARNTV